MELTFSGCHLEILFIVIFQSLSFSLINGFTNSIDNNLVSQVSERKFALLCDPMSAFIHYVVY